MHQSQASTMLLLSAAAGVRRGPRAAWTKARLGNKIILMERILLQTALTLSKYLTRGFRRE
jgi:hypothetical protein